MLPVVMAAMDDPQERDFMTQLYLEYEKLLFSTAWKFTTSRYDAEEIVQSSLERLIKKVSVLQRLERCTLAAYIVSTVRNTALNHLRKADRIRRTEADIDRQPEADEAQLSLDDMLILRENRRTIAAAWPDVPEGDRLLLEGKYLLELSDGELAALAGCKVDSVRMKLTRARRRAMKIMLEKEAEWI